MCFVVTVLDPVSKSGWEVKAIPQTATLFPQTCKEDTGKDLELGTLSLILTQEGPVRKNVSQLIKERYNYRQIRDAAWEMRKDQETRHDSRSRKRKDRISNQSFY